MPHQQDPSQFDEEIARFAEQDRHSPPPAHPVLFLGSSSIRFWRLNKFFPDHHRECLNRGFGGSGVADALHHFETLVPPYAPRAMVFYSGENDLSHGASVSVVVKNTRRFVESVHHVAPDCQLLLLPPKPTPMLWTLWPAMQEMRRAIEELAAGDDRVDVIDVATPMLGDDGHPCAELFMRDRLHLSPAGYTLWTKLITPWLDQRVANGH